MLRREWALICSIALVLLSFLAAGAAGNASAAPPKRVAFVGFRGGAAAPTRNGVIRIVRSRHFQVIPSGAIEATARRLKVRLTSDEGFAAVGKALRISSFVVGDVSGKEAALAVRAGATGAVVDQATWTGKNPRALSVTVYRAFWRKLGPAVSNPQAVSPSEGGSPPEEENKPDGGARSPVASSAPESEPSPSETSPSVPEPPAEEPPAREPTVRRPPSKATANDEGELPAVSRRRGPPAGEPPSRPLEALLVSVGPRVVHRTLEYVDDPTTVNSTYRLAAAPIAALAADFYPGALAAAPPALANIGVTAQLAYMLPVVKSKVVGGTGSYTTQSLAWSIGLKYRLPLGLFVTGGLGDHSFKIDRGSAPLPDVPATDYRFVHGGAGVRTHVSRAFVLMLQADYLHPLTMGQIHQTGYFPRATAWGFDATGAVGLQLSPRIELQLGGDVQRFKLAFNVTAEDAMNGARTGGGAVDLYLEGWLALAFVLDGAG